mgnify:CR=1 FL=1
MHIKQLLEKTNKLYTWNSTFNKIYESQLLLSNTLNKSLIEIILSKDLIISEKKKKKYFKKVFLRNLGKPISKITGISEFYSREFYVNTFTLDPRPESELIVDYAKKILKTKKNKLKILDLGTGSGCLIISIILELKKNNIFGVGIDICEKALKVAKKNAKKFGIKENLNFIKSDWFTEINQKFDLIISNPPYVKKKEIKQLGKEVRDFDPHISLDGGINGLKMYKIIALNSQKFLNNEGIICLEIGSEQKKDVTKIFESRNFIKIDEKKDLFNKDRLLIFKNKI